MVPDTPVIAPDAYCRKCLTQMRKTVTNKFNASSVLYQCDTCKYAWLSHPTFANGEHKPDAYEQPAPSPEPVPEAVTPERTRGGK